MVDGRAQYIERMGRGLGVQGVEVSGVGQSKDGRGILRSNAISGDKSLVLVSFLVPGLPG